MEDRCFASGWLSIRIT